ncbi:DEAD/DEAH box helicase [Bacteriovoracaceae bacterium]|nr:DEAD/DEAH box helicase [Bacteriovoracaceae bacterium]
MHDSKILERDNIQKIINSHFTKKDIQRAVQLVNSTFFNISFLKEKPGKYFIASGIIKDGYSFEVRITVKYQNVDEHIKSTCNCNEWNELTSCRHAAALYLHYLRNKDDHNLTMYIGPRGAQSGLTGAYPEVYGTILDSPQKLQNHQITKSFQDTVYALKTKKNKQFPIPKDLTGKLSLNFVSNSLNSSNEPVKSHYQFSYCDENETNIKEVSILGNTFLFNWNDGSAFYIPSKLKQLIDFIRFNKSPQLKQEVFNLFYRYLDFNIFYSDTNIDQFSTKDGSLAIDIHPDANSDIMSISVKFYDIDKNELPLPTILKLFSFESGLLEKFSKKLDALNFVSDIILNKHDPHWAKKVSSSHLVSIYFDAYKRSSSLYSIDEKENIIYSLSTATVSTFFSFLMQYFGKSIFRNSSYCDRTNTLVYRVGKSTLLEYMYRLNASMIASNIPITYKSNPLKVWKPQLKINRDFEKQYWFSMDFTISKEDADILSKFSKNLSSTINKDELLLGDPRGKLISQIFSQVSKKGMYQTDADGNLTFSTSFHKGRIFDLFELYKLGYHQILNEKELGFCDKLLNLTHMPSYEIPKVKDATPWPYQTVGYNWLRFLYENNLGACLSDDMGLGKTLQAIMLIMSVKKDIKNVLIVCPVSIIINWKNEIEKFSDLTTNIYHGTSRDSNNDALITLTSYGVMRKEMQNNFSKKNFDILIFDEVQHLKNSKSLGSIAAHKIKANFRICLTGTPVENNIDEFYNIIDLCVPGIWSSIAHKNQYSADLRQTAKSTCRPFILRRTKAQVLSDLPEKNDNLMFLSFSEKEKKNYINTLMRIKTEISELKDKNKYGTVLKSILTLRKLCLWQKKDAENANDYESTKIVFLIENLKQIVAEGHQCIIFSQFTSYLDIIQKEIEANSWEYCRIDGQQLLNKRQNQVDKFQNNGVPIFLISLKAGGFGLNLTAASYIFLMDPWWNPAVESQAIDRAHRIGQKNKLTVYRPIIKDSIEEKVLKLQQGKLQLFKDLLEGQDDQIYSGRLTMKDFEALLQD